MGPKTNVWVAISNTREAKEFHRFGSVENAKRASRNRKNATV